ncbi:unnamed protein product [Rotaria sp. Silwood1]|nr:unnamed protein product [Rotaria sp. Silwood1]CAF3743525.1 unnamed protein product [Rotaria sp. Silwood1]CAF4901080.1 unnamed protein product [Rotaria sp. Silwood1]
MQKLRKKQVRFRWYLAYTILRNYQLFDLRKDLSSRVTQMHAQRNNSLVDVEEYLIEIHISQQINKEINDYPLSPAEHYINIRSNTLYKTIAEQLNEHCALPVCEALSSNSTAVASNISNLTTIHTQSSYTQQMQNCRQETKRKIHKKRPYRYIYESPTQERMTHTSLAATMNTPHILDLTSKQRAAPPMTTTGERLPSSSSFQLPYSFKQLSSVSSSFVSDNQVRTIKENLRKKEARKIKSPSQHQTKANEFALEQLVSSPRMNRIQNDNEVTAMNKNST